MNRKIKCLIVDDEPLALDLIESYVKKTPFLELAGKCSSALQAIDLLEQDSIDLVFLDIQMPELSGMDLAKTLKDKTKVVFTTAFEEYAFQGFKVDAVDYLLKPFNFEEFFQAATKAKDLIRLSATKNQQEQDNSAIFVKSDYKQIKVILRNVLYFEGLKDYVKIHIEGKDQPILSLISLKSLEEQLPESLFLRVHRSYIVNLDKIEAVERGQIILKEVRITVADQYKERFQQFLSSKTMN